MSNLFSTKGIKETSGGSQKFIYGGVYDAVVIKDVKAGVSSQKQTPFVEVEVHTVEGGETSAKGFKFYFSENAAEKSMQKLQHIVTKISTLEDFENIVQAFEGGHCEAYLTKPLNREKLIDHLFELELIKGDKPTC